MANGFSPYQIAAPTTNLMSQSELGRKKKKDTDLATTLQMGKMEEAFTRETERLGLDASRSEAGSKNTRRAEKLGQLASLFINPLLGGLIGGFIGGKKHRRARKAREKLLNLNEKYSKTFLRNQSSDYLSEAESLQLGKSGDFMSGLQGAVTTGMMAKMFGGRIKGGEGGSFADKFFGRDVKGFSDKLTTATQEMNKNAFLEWDNTLPMDSKATNILASERPGFFDKRTIFKEGKGLDLKNLMLLPALLQLFEQDY